MASIGRRGWRQAKSALTTKFDRRVTLPLADTLERVARLQDQVGELTEIIREQVGTELLGRLLATASGRLDAVEESLRQITAGGMTPAGVKTLGSSESTGNRLREEAGASLASEDPSQH